MQEEFEANEQVIEKLKASRDKDLNLFDEKLIDQELNQEFKRQLSRQNELEASLKGCT